MFTQKTDLSPRNIGNQKDLAAVRNFGLVFASENHLAVDDDIEIWVIEECSRFREFTPKMLTQFSQVRDRLVDDNLLFRRPGKCVG